jgi:hypothetical protein
LIYSIDIVENNAFIDGQRQLHLRVRRMVFMDGKNTFSGVNNIVFMGEESLLQS